MDRFSYHHAFLIKGNKAEAEALYAELLKDKNVEAHFIFEKNLSIEAARELKEIAAQTALKSMRYVIVSAYAVGHEAQNALLKTLEELPESKKIIFFVENTDVLLPTFVSRFSKNESVIAHVTDRRKDFSIKTLLKDVEQICKDIKDEVSTKSQAAAFLDALIVHKKEDKVKVKKLLYFKLCLSRPSASVKQILESAVVLVS